MSKNIWNEKDLSAAELEYFKSFYFSHSLKETQEHFNISQSTIYKRLEKYNITRGKRLTAEKFMADVSKEELADFYSKHTRAETGKHFNVTDGVLCKVLKQYQISKGPDPITELAKQISKEELEEYYLNHSQEETRQYFNQKYNITAPYRIMSLLTYYKIDKLNNSKKRITEYLDTVDKISLHDLATALDLKYCNVTHLVKQLDVKDKIQYTPASSSYEKEIESFLLQLNVKYLHQSRRVLENGLELDFYLPDYNIGIEINGAYWHSSLFKDKKYHLDKSRAAMAQGIRLIHIWDYEWDNFETQEKLKSLIKTAVGQYDGKIFARNCVIKEVSKTEAKTFITKYHLQGYRAAKVNLGLYYKGKLIQILTFDNTKYNKNLTGQNDWEIIRECSRANTIIIGGKNKLFKYFLDNYSPDKVFSYCDYNKFTGNSYLNLGMRFIGYSGPDMKWLMPNGQVLNRTPQKNKELKEKAQAKLFGCGSLKYVYEKE